MASLSALLHSSAAHAQIRDAVAAALKHATRVDAAIAFITAAGADFAQGAIDTSRADLRLVTSVRWPTDLRAVATLATRWPGAIWIHLGGLAPQELGGDRYQMHSKALAVDEPHNAFTGFVGSHNWTFTALEGVNLEATVEVRCDATEPFARDLHRHVDACIAESEPFDPAQVDDYLAIQRALQPAPLPDPDGEDDDFDRYPAVVIHAEDPESLAERSQLRVYLGPDAPIADAFIYERRVDLYLYPAGTLLTPERPMAEPTLFTGDIAMVNMTADAHVRDRPIDSAILDLHAPQIAGVSTFPDVTGAVREVAVHLDRQGRRAPFVYHSATGKRGRPTASDKVVFEHAPIPGLPRVNRDAARRYLHCPKFEGDDELMRLVPTSVRREVAVAVPASNLYPEDPASVLRQRFDRRGEDFKTWRRLIDDTHLRRNPGRHYVVRNSPRSAYRFVFVATHRSKR